jgi:hypothetical protein
LGCDHRGGYLAYIPPKKSRAAGVVPKLGSVWFCNKDHKYSVTLLILSEDPRLVSLPIMSPSVILTSRAALQRVVRQAALGDCGVMLSSTNC